ncbi:hypothetical protein LU293_00180 [Moraxella nasovis]|uniref:hypothetical protein n=1 Tax=Moraxella nasovis TaxID=2904121 RepID=UPI001F60ADA1|nr:hypothetical protein [Moraxella nasovis]UNU73370.1 hypothetical protein LU293_00180 [Moraxella nasovis]
MTVLLTTKTKNTIKKATKKAQPSMDLEFHINQKTANGKKLGCLGFIKNRKNNKTVFISTTFTNKVLYKCARWLQDYQGCARWAD